MATTNPITPRMTTLASPLTNSAQDNMRITPSGLLRRRAQQAPGALALLDPPNKTGISGADPRRLTFADADAAVGALAAYFLELGLAPGDCVAVQLPNFIESPLVLLGAWRAGLTVAAIPMLWRATEIARVCDMLEPAALIAKASYDGERPAELMRDVAATRLSVRFVLGFGSDLPDGVTSLDQAIVEGPTPNFVPRINTGPALITFTARAGAPLVPVFRHEDEILLQGAMGAMALSLDRHDVLLNPYPLTGPVGLSLGIAPWLIGGTALIQHEPFDYNVLVEQVLSAGATATALPGTVLDRFIEDEVYTDQKCSLRHVGRVWSAPKLSQGAKTETQEDIGAFDLYPLGDLACLIEYGNPERRRDTLPLGSFSLSTNGEETAFLETGLTNGTEATANDIAIRGSLVPRGRSNGPAARDTDGFIKTGLKGVINDSRLLVSRDPELVYHGGFTIAACELDGLYQAFPDFLDAACFVLPDPVVGDRIFAAVVPVPSKPLSLAGLRGFLDARGVAPYKHPDKLLIVQEIPRDVYGQVLRKNILELV